MMNSGAPITGSDRRPLKMAGMDIGKIPLTAQTKRDAPLRKMHRERQHLTAAKQLRGGHAS
jgi:hypothetical protein